MTSPVHSRSRPSHVRLTGCSTSGTPAEIAKDVLGSAERPLGVPVEAKGDGSGLERWKEKDLTLGGEINKLASNISLGRDAAGVHYRSDSIPGLLVGEQQAIGLLCDYSRTYNERFEGFALTKFDGKKIRIAGGKVVS